MKSNKTRFNLLKKGPGRIVREKISRGLHQDAKGTIYSSTA